MNEIYKSYLNNKGRPIEYAHTQKVSTIDIIVVTETLTSKEDQTG